jgi:undecaprenyl-diphosphatase
VVAVSGGDGTIRCAVGILSGSETALLAVPGGTHNHFAKALGIDTIEIAAQVATSGERVAIDIGQVNGEPFIYNASVGWYAELVHRREKFEKKMPRRLAKVLSVAVHLPWLRAFTVDVGDGTTRRTWMVWIGNGEFGTHLNDFIERESLADQRLDLRVLSAAHRLPRPRALGALLAGRIEDSPAIERLSLPAVTLRLRRPQVLVALDGELVTLATPLAFRSVAASLNVLVPSAAEVTGES